MQYDLEGRTRKLAHNTLQLLRTIFSNELNKNIISQLVRSVTSVGANYCEANAASSKKDFRNKIFICRKEIQETKYWLELLAEIEPNKKNKLRSLWREAQELTLIFSKISSTLNKNSKLEH